ncbi:hypothetical protein Rsub_12642 [Raphidocelis subcapitata]|uniref:Glycosyl transferase family 1 domain-containing protein n=1 Tax=Raphidocelis subcapitata TaxID=307507 RepID=A0A2V0PK81_9CHLO|nr:hypothetical protein Rsub_12642 [Raphidocelis subcapitata]|eukprot:GBF99949.1 hypothetical protein Rsub_12642 [Raphidocelis subcapitata]
MRSESLFTALPGTPMGTRAPRFSSSFGGGWPSLPGFAPAARRRSSFGGRARANAAAVAVCCALAVAAVVVLGRRQAGAAVPLLAGWRAAGAGGGGPAPLDASMFKDRLLFPVWWFAPFYSGSGYGAEALSYISALLHTHALDAADVWVTHSGDGVVPGVVRSMEPEGRALLERQEYAHLARGGLPEFELTRPAIAVCHSFPDCWHRPVVASDPGAAGDTPMSAPGCPCPPASGSGVVYRVGRTMYETAGLPKHLVEHCNAMDEVWVPTEFNRKTFTAAGVDPRKLHVVEEGIDASHWDPEAYDPLDPISLRPEQIAGLPRGVGQARAGGEGSDGRGRPFIFLSVFKLETRKGWDVLLDAFLSEFGPHEDVELHILTRPYPGGGPKNAAPAVMWRWLSRVKGLGRARDARRLPRVYVYSKHVGDDLYPRLYLGADAVVLPTRGEGWGRPQMEAMAMARPLITTRWSGPTAYITEANAYPLSIEGLSLASADMNATDPEAAGWNLWFDGERWARPSTHHLRQLMRRVVLRPEEAAAKGAAARATVLERFTPDVLAARVRAELVRINGLLAADPAVPRRLEAPRELSAPARPPLARGGAIRTRTRDDGSSSGSSGGGASFAPVGEPGAQEMAAMARAAREAGFTRADGGRQASLRPATMPLSEMLSALESTAPLTRMTREPPRTAGAPAAGEQAAGAPGGAWQLPPQGVAGGEGDEEPYDEDADDGSIVLHPA